MEPSATRTLPRRSPLLRCFAATGKEAIHMLNRRILVPLDGSAFSRAILRDLSRVFAPLHSEVTLLRVDELPEAVVAMPPRPLPVDGTAGWTIDEYESQAEAELASHPIYAEQTRASRWAELEAELLPAMHELERAGFRVSMRIAFGDPAGEIIATAKEIDADVIAMATHGRTGVAKLVLGSVSSAVLQRAGTAVLLVNPFHYLPPKAPQSDG
jgi:nucleotide-binding universal stress UspA family protein